MCLSPIRVRLPTFYNKDMFVSCGKCVECLEAKRKQLYVKLYYEFMNSTSAHFITLTYRDESVPHCFVVGSGEDLLNLCRADVTSHIKRWRSLCNKKGYDLSRFSYFLCSEYGSKYLRPHYHILIFNVDDFRAVSLFNQMWIDYYGFTLDKPIGREHKDFVKVSKYVSKYVTKSLVNDYFTNKLNHLYECKCEKMKCTTSHHFGCCFDTELIYHSIFDKYKDFDDLFQHFEGFSIFIDGLRYKMPSSLVDYLFKCEYEQLSTKFLSLGRKMPLYYWRCQIPILSRLGATFCFERKLLELHNQKQDSNGFLASECALQQRIADRAIELSAKLSKFILEDAF